VTQGFGTRQRHVRPRRRFLPAQQSSFPLTQDKANPTAQKLRPWCFTMLTPVREQTHIHYTYEAG